MEHVVIEARDAASVASMIEIATGIKYNQVLKYRQASRRELDATSPESRERYRKASSLFRLVEAYRMGWITYQRLLFDIARNDKRIAEFIDENAKKVAIAFELAAGNDNVRISQILEAVQFEIGISPAEIKGKSRKRQIAEARHIAAWLCYRMKTRLSYVAIGLHLGGRDHTTIMNSIQRVDEDERLREIAMRIAKRNGWTIQ